MDLAEFNALHPDAAAEIVTQWADIPAWVETIVAARPYGSVDELVGIATGAAAAWTRDDLDAALARHARIGERAEGDHPDAAASRREQASMASASQDAATAIAAGNAEYERRFGRVFLIRAAGRTPDEMLAELERRLGNDPDTEASEALCQLREIAELRLRGTVTATEGIRI